MTTTNDERFDDLLRAVSRAPSVRPADIDLVGRTVGRFVVDRRLGQGGMGVVYEATDPVLARKVALKVLRAGLRAGEPSTGASRARLHDEARRIAALCHPNIATIYDVGEHDGIVFLAMERASGESLRARLAKPPALSLDRAVSVLRSIAAGLACAHDAGILHRDLKPENVVTGDDGTVKLVDFGIATSRAEGARSGGRPAGTRRYMAPEISAGAPSTARGDVYAFGVLAREVLSATAVPSRDRSTRAALGKLAAACAAEESERRPRDGRALLAQIEAIAGAPRPRGRMAMATAGAAVLAAAVGVLAARSVSPRPVEGAATSLRAPSAGAPRVEAETEREAPSAAASDATTTEIDPRAPRPAVGSSVEERHGEGPYAMAGEPAALADHTIQADPERSGAPSTAVPVTTSVDRRGRVFAVVPLDAMGGGVAPAPAGTMMPIGGIAGEATRAEVVADGNGGAVIRFTVRVPPGGTAAPGGTGTHSFSPGTLPTAGVASTGSAQTPPIHVPIHIGDGGPTPAHPAQPQSQDEAKGPVVCTAASPSAIQGTHGNDGTMRVITHDESGDEMLIAVLSPEGELTALGEAAAPCEDARDQVLDLDEG